MKRRIRHAVGSAIHDWRMIRPNDRILVGLSGGKDSQVLLSLLLSLQRRAPVPFKLYPVHVDPGFEDSFSEELARFSADTFCPVEVHYTDFGVIAHSEHNRENPCFLCARLRRKRLFETAKERGCNRIALGHHKDDIIETLFINIFYAGKIGTMKPRQSFFKGTLDIIRPLAYVDKKKITAYASQLGLPDFINPCPSADRTKREEIRGMLETMYKHNRHIKGNIFRAMSNVRPDYLLGNKDDRYPEST